MLYLMFYIVVCVFILKSSWSFKLLKYKIVQTKYFSTETETKSEAIETIQDEVSNKPKPKVPGRLVIISNNSLFF